MSRITVGILAALAAVSALGLVADPALAFCRSRTCTGAAPGCSGAWSSRTECYAA